jgi:hypothetical protein
MKVDGFTELLAEFTLRKANMSYLSGILPKKPNETIIISLQNKF